MDSAGHLPLDGGAHDRGERCCSSTMGRLLLRVPLPHGAWVAALLTAAAALGAFTVSSTAAPAPARDANATTPRPATTPVAAGPSFTGAPRPPVHTTSPYPALFDLGGCSGALVRFPASQDDDPALVLTAGHCVGRTGDPDATVSDARPAQAHPVTLLNADGRALTSTTVAEVEFAGSPAKGSTDLGLLRLTATFGVLDERYGAQPRTLASDGGAVGTTVRVLSGFWREETTCRQTERSGVPGPRTTVTFEAGSSEEPCADIRPGWSGSPVVRPSDDRVVAVDSVGVHVGDHHLWNAGPPVAMLLSCRGKDGRISLAVPGCHLR